MKHLGANNIHSKPTSKVGFVLKPHGYSGHLRFQLDDEANDPEEFLLLLINDKFVPFAIESINLQACIVKLKGFDSVEAVEHLVALPIVEFINDEVIQKSSLVGYNLVDTNTNEHYVVTDEIEMPGHSLLEFRCGFKDCLLPFHSDIVSNIDHDTQTIYASFPEGILDL